MMNDIPMAPRRPWPRRKPTRRKHGSTHGRPAKIEAEGKLSLEVAESSLAESSPAESSLEGVEIAETDRERGHRAFDRCLLEYVERVSASTQALRDRDEQVRALLEQALSSSFPGLLA